MADSHNKVFIDFVGNVAPALQSFSVIDGALAKLAGRMGASMGVIGGAVAGAVTAIGLAWAGAVKESSAHAIQFEALMTNINETMGESASKFEEWQATTGRAMGFSKEESASMAVQVSANMRMISKSQEDLMQKTTKFMEISAILKSRSAMSQEEITRRMMSAMNQEADGAMELGLDVRTSAITMSNAFKQMADGKPWADLSSSQQKAILYQYILDSVTSRFGDKVANTTALQMSVLSASLKDLRLAFGQVYVPIIAKVLPAIIKLVNWLTTLFSLVARFNEGLWGHKTAKDTANVNKNTDSIKRNYDATQKLGKAIDDVRKKTKKAQQQNEGFLASFDEVHTIPKAVDPTDPSGGTGGIGGTGGGGMFDDIGDSALDATEKVSGLFGKMKEIGDGLALIGKGINEVFHGNFKQGFYDIADGIGKVWGAMFGKEAGKNMGDGLKSIYDGLNDIKKGNFSQGFTELAVGFGKVWSAMFGHEKGKQMTDGLLQIKKSFDDLKKGNYSQAIKGLYEGLGKVWGAIFGHDKGKYLTDGLTGVYNGFKKIKDGNFRGGLDSLGTGMNNLFKAILGQKGTTLVSGIAKIYSGLRDIKNLNLSSGLHKIADGFSAIFKSMGKNTIGQGLKSVYDKVRNKWNVAMMQLATWKNPVTGNYTFKSAQNWRLPELYNGGITDGSTIARVGDNVGGREVIAPLDRLQGMIANTMNQTMSMRGSGGGGYNTGGDIVLTVDGREFARIIKPFQNLEDKRVGNNIRTKPI